jgi:hypothetical protein
MPAIHPLADIGALCKMSSMRTTLPLYTALALGTFVVCCFLVAFASKQISQSVVGTYLLLGLAALSLFAWPVLLARTFQEWARARRKPD